MSNVDSFLSMSRMEITPFSNCFEQLSLARQFATISSPAGVSVNTSNKDHGEIMIRMTPDYAVLNDEFVAGLIGLVPAHLSWSHSLQRAHA